MAFKLKSGNKISFKNMGSSPAKHPHTERRAHGTYGHNTDTGKSVAEGGKARPDNPNYVPPKKESPVKTHEPGHKKGASVSDFDDTVAYTKKKEELLNQGFTQEDADQMIKNKAVTGKVDVESYKDRMKRLSKKYDKSPEEINKILKSKDYTEGRTKIHSPNKHVTGTTHTHDDDLPEGYERGERKDLKAKKLDHIGKPYMRPPYKDTTVGTRPYEKRQGYHGYKDFDSILSKEGKKSPAKQDKWDINKITVDGKPAKEVIKQNEKERQAEIKRKEQEMTDLINNPNQEIDRSDPKWQNAPWVKRITPAKHKTGSVHTHNGDLPEGYERGEKKDLKGGGTMTVIKKKEEKKKVYAPGETRIIKSGDKEYTYTPPKKKKKKRSKVKRTKRPKARKVKNLVTGRYNTLR